MALATLQSQNTRTPQLRCSLLAYGFRPHFLLAGVAAATLIPLWALAYVAGIPLGSSWPPTLWHAHEMLFGFVASAVAGFLLTAVPSWTGHKGFAGRPLALLVGLWLVARAMIATSALWPSWLTAAVDLAFLPVLALFIAPPLLRSRNRNAPLLLVLALLWSTNFTFHVALMRDNPPLALESLRIGIDLVLIMMTVIGGRIVPAFTSSALRARNLPSAIRSSPALTACAVAAMLLVTLSDLAHFPTAFAGAIAAIAAAIQLLRLLQWGTSRTLREPIVWVLHLAYAWLPLGLALKACALLTGSAWAAFWLHALTIGSLATMILAVMSRASLGHTGRPLTIDPLITLAYLLLTAAAAMRVLGLAALALPYPVIVAAAAFLWTAAFALFLWVYAPILCSPRIDGRPG